MSLSKEQLARYRTSGIIYGLPVFTQDEIGDLNQGLGNILGLLSDGESTKEIREWHEASTFLFDLCMMCVLCIFF